MSSGSPKGDSLPSREAHRPAPPPRPDSSGVYICKSIVNDLGHGNYIRKSEENYLRVVQVRPEEAEERLRGEAALRVAVVAKPRGLVL